MLLTILHNIIGKLRILLITMPPQPPPGLPLIYIIALHFTLCPTPTPRPSPHLYIIACTSRSVPPISLLTADMY